MRKSLGNKRNEIGDGKNGKPDHIGDITKLYGSTHCFTYDLGFTSTASCESKITYIDGDAGVLR